MPSATLLGQSILSGLFIGGLYALMGLGLSLAWGYLKLINLAHLAFAFLAAYVTYQFVGYAGLSPPVALLIVVPAFFLLGVALQALYTRFAVGEFASLLVTFGIAVIVESLIQYFWTADFRKLQIEHGTASLRIGTLFVPVIEALMLLVAAALSLATWAWLRFTYLGKAMRASAENPEIAAAFGIDPRRLALLMSGIGTAYAGVAGVFIALTSTLFPAQIFAWVGVVFAVVILGGLGNPLGVLAAGLAIGVSESVTMAVTEPTWAPLVAFTLLILVLILRPGRI
ncbi:MAG: branched-chain amino acid ABC transporter permease [Alphaproteobacteria bacterium]|nr:branched-chain amino acid ABC transporter permease [Alphaproteobacteria bacterium]